MTTANASEEEIKRSDAEAAVYLLALPTDTSQPYEYATQNADVPITYEGHWEPINILGADSE